MNNNNMIQREFFFFFLQELQAWRKSVQFTSERIVRQVTEMTHCEGQQQSYRIMQMLQGSERGE
jgi:hypothetical protein